MQHAPDGSLRRLLDDPVAVSDNEVRHVERCERCRRRSQQVARDASHCGQLLRVRAPDVLAADLDKAWAEFRARLGEQRSERERPSSLRQRRWSPRERWSSLRQRWIGPRRRWRLAGTTLGSGATLAGAGLVLATVAAAATLSTTVFAPTAVAPVPISARDLQPIASLLGVGTVSELQDVRQPSGSRTLPFGTLTWTSSGEPSHVASLGDAETATGVTVALPSTLPDGVGAPDSFLAVPQVTATVSFGAGAGPLAGSTLQATLGPAVLVGFAGEGDAAVSPLVLLASARPLATSSGATTSQLESFVLSQPDVPADLAEQLRLIGDLRTTLPVPTPQGFASSTAVIDGAPAVVVDDPSGGVSGAVWEDSAGIVHVVGGLLDEEDLLGVARQLG